MNLIGMEKELDAGLKALKRRQPVLYYGFTGNGKTMLALKYVCNIAVLPIKVGLFFCGYLFILGAAAIQVNAGKKR